MAAVEMFTVRNNPLDKVDSPVELSESGLGYTRRGPGGGPWGPAYLSS